MVEKNRTNWIFRVRMKEDGEEEQFQALLEKAKEIGFQVLCVSPSGEKMWVELLYPPRDANLNKKIQALVSISGVEGGKWIQQKDSYLSDKENMGTQIGVLLEA